MIKLDVPYRSQEAEDAKRYGNDCGIACVAMLHEYRFRDIVPHLDVDYLANIRPPAPFSRTIDLVALGRQVGLNLKTTDASIGLILDLDRIRYELRLGNPCILLVCYSRIPDRLNIRYTGGHYMLAVGYAIGHILVHDPDWYGLEAEQGAYRAYPDQVIESAMKGCPGFFSIANQGVLFEW